MAGHLFPGGPDLLLVPPAQPRAAILVGGARQPPNLSALQPLHRPAADLDRRPGRDLGDVAAAGLRRLLAGDERHPAGYQPSLSVLAPHRGDRQAAGADRGGVQHPLAPPGAPRREPALPRPQLRGHSDHLGPAVRHLRAQARRRTLPVWRGQESRRFQQAPRSLSRLDRHRSGCPTSPFAERRPGPCLRRVWPERRRRARDPRRDQVQTARARRHLIVIPGEGQPSGPWAWERSAASAH
jgi:hypothetical protein